MTISTYEMAAVPRAASEEETPFFEVHDLRTSPSPKGVRVKVTFRNGVKLNFQLDPAQSYDLVEGIASALAEKTRGQKAEDRPSGATD